MGSTGPLAPSEVSSSRPGMPQRITPSLEGREKACPPAGPMACPLSASYPLPVRDRAGISNQAEAPFGCAQPGREREGMPTGRTDGLPALCPSFIGRFAPASEKLVKTGALRPPESLLTRLRHLSAALNLGGREKACPPAGPMACPLSALPSSAGLRRLLRNLSRPGPCGRRRVF